MKILAVISLTWCACSGAHAEAIYKSAEQYVASRTKSNIPEGKFEGSIENYICHVSFYPKYRGCRVGSLSHQPGISRVFGMLQSIPEKTGFIFILEPDGNGLLHVAVESQPFKIPDGYPVFAVEELRADANDRFHVQFTYGSPSMPNSAIYRFKLIKNQWRVTGLDHSELMRCDDDSVGTGNRYSANFLTGTVLIEEFKNCKSVESKKYQSVFPKFLLLNFVPIDAKYMLTVQ